MAPPRDAMRFINEQDEATLQRFIERLEIRGADPRFTGYREDYLRELKLDATVLEIGCGTGVIARAVARRPGRTGQVTAVDQSPVLLAAAQRLAAAEDLGGRIDFRTGDANALDLPDATFDAVIAHTLISHVADPAQVLGEAARVARPGGKVVIFDGDYASLTFGCSDGELARDIETAFQGVIVTGPRVMRDLPRLLRPAGLELVWARAYVTADIGTSDFFLGLAEAYAPLIAKQGLLPAERVETWLAEQRRTHEEGTFFAACAYYTYVATG
ncbi:methyltransferase domain-containing protein [Nonomuraea sp. NPDC050404]|uniref:methyltransferase domain-containing protein n=1 Tax=Nonomuraea sp. NPDC050404 TaxID=3155783 RepID=UPI0033D2C102